MNNFLKNFRRLSGIKELSLTEEFTGFKRIHVLETVGRGISSLQLNGISINRDNSKDNVINYQIKEGILTEEKEFVFPENQKGGIIVFSIDVNKKFEYKNLIDKIKEWFKQKYQSLLNRIFKDKKLSKIISKHEEITGFSIGKFFKGRYKSPNGKHYDETSTSIEIIGIGSELLEIVASKIASEFNQESVLVKDYIKNEIYLANKK